MSNRRERSTEPRRGRSMYEPPANENEIPDEEWREIGTIDQFGHARIDWAAASRWRPLHELLWRR